MKALTARVVEVALDGEVNEHPGLGRTRFAGRWEGRVRVSGMRVKMVITHKVGVI